MAGDRAAGASWAQIWAGLRPCLLSFSGIRPLRDATVGNRDAYLRYLYLPTQWYTAVKYIKIGDEYQASNRGADAQEFPHGTFVVPPPMLIHRANLSGQGIGDSRRCEWKWDMMRTCPNVGAVKIVHNLRKVCICAACCCSSTKCCMNLIH